MFLFGKKEKRSDIPKTAQVREPRLAVTVTFENGERKGQTQEVSGHGDITIGTAKDCGLRIGGEGVRKHHCRIFKASEALYIESIDADAITRIGGMRIHQANPLRRGDIVSVGEHDFSVVY